MLKLPFLISLLTASLAAQPTLVRLVAVGDASANADMPTVNDGSAPIVTCGKDFPSSGTFRVWMTRGHFQFDLTPIVGRTLPTRVRLRVWQARAGAAGCLDVTAHRVAAAWSESTLTWQNKPALDATVAARACVGDSFDGGWKVFDVTALALDWLNNVHPNFGIVIRDPTEHTAGAARPMYASSREATNAAEHPHLEVAWDTQAYGVGCGPWNPVPNLDLDSGEPMIGGTYELGARTFASGAGVVHIVGFSDTTWGGAALPLNLAFLSYPACNLYASVQVTIAGVANNRGRAQIQFPVPNVNFLRGKRLFHQVVGVDSNLVLSFTNGYAVKFF